MKVLHLVKTAVGASWACRQIQVLTESGVRVTVALPSAEGEMVEQYKAAGAKVLPVFTDVPVKQMWKMPATLESIRRLVREEQPDLIHSHFVGTTYMLRLALGKDHPIPRVFQVPGPLHLEQGIYGKIDVALAGERDYWIGSCRWTCQKYEEMGVPADKVFLAFYGTHIDHFGEQSAGTLREAYGLAKDIPTVGMVSYFYKPKPYLGQFTGLKGHEYFIQAMKRVLEVVPNAKGFVVGNAWGKAAAYERKIHRLADRLCGDSIQFTGYRSDIPEIYRDIDVAVHPSLSENLGGAVESMLAKVPTIATNVGGFPDIVIPGVTGWLVPPRDSEKLAEAIIESLLDRQEAERRAIAGQNLVRKELDVRKTAGDVLAHYRTILHKLPS